jgi:hypothetical protein
LGFLESALEVAGKLKRQNTQARKFDGVIQAAREASALVNVYRFSRGPTTCQLNESRRKTGSPLSGFGADLTSRAAGDFSMADD